MQVRRFQGHKRPVCAILNCVMNGLTEAFGEGMVLHATIINLAKVWVAPLHSLLYKLESCEVCEQLLVVDPSFLTDPFSIVKTDPWISNPFPIHN